MRGSLSDEQADGASRECGGRVRAIYTLPSKMARHGLSMMAT